MNTPTTVFVYNDFRFWMILGFMIYLAGCFFIYLFADKIPKAERIQFWNLTYVFYTIKNILFAIGILIFVFQKPTPKHHVTKPNAKHLSDLT